jgi:hypothetical protein
LFLLFSLLFANIYQAWPDLIAVNGHENAIEMNPISGVGTIREASMPDSPWHKLYFSVVTMTTLGFGDIAASTKEFWGFWGQTCIMIQVIIGYLILGALITRFGVVFQADGPPVGLTPTRGDIIWKWVGVAVLASLTASLFTIG